MKFDIKLKRKEQGKEKDTIFLRFPICMFETELSIALL